MTFIEVRSTGMGGHGVSVHSRHGTIRIGIGPGRRRPEVREAVDRFARTASATRTDHALPLRGSTWSGLVIPEPGISRRRSRFVRAAITGGACLIALVGLLRLLVG